MLSQDLERDDLDRNRPEAIEFPEIVLDDDDDDDDDDEEEEPETKPEQGGAEKPQPPMPLDEKLLKNRTIMLFGQIDMDVAREISKRLLVLDAESNDEIKLYINSPGGHVESGDTIFDIIRYIKSPVKVIGTGWVASAAALIYVSVPVEQRYSLPNTRFLLHQPMGGARGQAADIAIEAQEILRMRRRLNETFARQTGQLLEKVEEDTDRNFWMSAIEAQDYGLVGKIVERTDEV